MISRFFFSWNTRRYFELLYTRIIFGAAILLVLIWSQEFLMNRQMNIFQKLNRWRTKKTRKPRKPRNQKEEATFCIPWKAMKTHNNTHAHFDIHTNIAVETYTASWDYWWSVFFQLTWWLVFVYMNDNISYFIYHISYMNHTYVYIWLWLKSQNAEVARGFRE